LLYEVLYLHPEIFILDLVALQLLSYASQILLLVLKRPFQLLRLFRVSLLMLVLHVAHLKDLLVSLIERCHQLVVLISKSANEHVLLLEALLYNADLLRISKGIFASNDFLKLLSESSAFIDIKLHFNFDFSNLC